MQTRKFYLFLSILLSLAVVSNAQINEKIILKDIQKLVGSWEGSLTYLDYSTGKSFTMEAEVDIKKINSSNKFVFSNHYPKEPNANSTDTILISKDGHYVGSELVKSRNVLSNGEIEIITEASGKDGNDNKPALFRHTYTFGTTNFRNRKDVKFEGGNKWINRHEYMYTRKTN